MPFSMRIIANQKSTKELGELVDWFMEKESQAICHELVETIARAIRKRQVRFVANSLGFVASDAFQVCLREKDSPS